MDNAWIIAFYKETDPVKRLELLKANTGDGESEKDKYRKQLWIARYGKRTPVKDEFMRCLMEMKYLAEGTTVDLGGKRRKQGAKIAATLGLSESLLQEKVYKEILLQELQNVFLKFIEVSRGGRAFTSLVFGMGQMSDVRQVVPAAVERKENSAIQRHAASVTVLQRTEDVFLY